ncbi:MAG: cytochrome c family protein [Candidatus Eisenbacteria bacterium]|uniref:Cytochrome c family protein n=1 Tax=Eiseniibacteriota bacterium TaxID=2212470 RepID=A0A948RV07_UNCEI|nr:cytochrome c family protein [Candidatus Eisenbacteria bacterium]MBU1949009.1 cytochrome c family protein [Candidatus Eisenbacteria bacterium]MBU2691518.1 cytochrome c family protein [Candidatus Eisenbacteria bacterium]
MSRLGILGVALIAVTVIGAFFWTSVAVQATDAEKKEFQYISSAKCKMCHKGEKKGEIFEKWEAGPHAKAFASLPEASQKDEKCLGCHTTGFGKGGYVAGAENAADFAHVGCEACHGPGSEYKSATVMKDHALSVAAGMIEVGEAQCKICHTEALPEACWGEAKAAPKFDFAVASKKVDHKIAKAE